MCIKFSLDRRSYTDGVERPIQSIPSVRGKVLVAPGMNGKKIFTKEKKNLHRTSLSLHPFGLVK